jgi:hypothetical protein
MQYPQHNEREEQYQLATDSSLESEVHIFLLLLEVLQSLAFVLLPLFVILRALFDCLCTFLTGVELSIVKVEEGTVDVIGNITFSLISVIL